MRDRCVLLLVIMLAAGAAGYLTSGCGRGKQTLPTSRASRAEATADQRVASAKQLYRDKRYAEAYQEAKTALAADDQNPKAWCCLAATAHQNSRDEEADRAYRQAIALKPDSANAYNNLGDIYESRSRWTEAAEQYQAALRLDPSFAAPYAGLGDIYRKNGAWAKAVEYYRQALSHDSKDYLSQQYLALATEALTQTRQRGFVPADTLKQLAFLDGEARANATTLTTRGLAVRSLEAPPDAPSMAMHIEFSRNKYRLDDLSPAGRKQLDEAASVLSGPDWAGKSIVIEGHACSCGSDEHNRVLSQHRAETIGDYLVERGVVKPEAVVVIARGEDNPVVESPHNELPPAQCENDEAHSLNRRVVIREWRGESGTSGQAATDPGTAPRPSAKVSFWHRPARGGEFRRLTDGAVLHSKDQISIFLLAYHPVYAYIYHRGSGGDCVRLFPNPEYCQEGPAENPLQPGRKYWLPRYGDGIPLDNVPGKEETFVYLSAGPDPEFDNLPEQATGAKSEEVVAKFSMRGVAGIAPTKMQDICLPSSYYAHVWFRHER